MRYLAVATDFDGTMAHDGVVDIATLDALTRVSRSGRKLLMVTGRELDELMTVFPQYKMFDRIVAENGALLHDPAANTFRCLAPEPPPALLAHLREQAVPFSVGRSIIATVEPFEHAVLAAIKNLGLEWHVIFNKGSVMVLPSGVTKATGLAAALAELEMSPEQVVGIGDAENDHAFLRACGLGVAVANALPALKATADLVTTQARGAGVTEMINRLLTDELVDITPRPANHGPVMAVPAS